MTLIFSNGAKIKVPSSKNVTLFLRRNYPDLLAEWCEYLDHFNNAFKNLDKHTKQ
jgi:hypothetical protein